MKTVRNTLFGYSKWDIHGTAFTVLSPRKANGNFPDRTTDSQVKCLEDAAAQTGLNVELYASEDTHYVHCRTPEDQENFIIALKLRGMVQCSELMR